MADFLEMSPDLTALARETAPEELPALVGKLAEAQALALSRLSAPSNRNGPAAPLEDRLLTMPQVAERLGIKEHQAREMGRRGELPALRVGERRVRVSAQALAEWIAAREEGTLRRSRQGQ